MNRFIKYFLIASFIIFSSDLLAQEKIAILDLKYVLNQSKAGKGAQDFLKKSYTENVKKLWNKKDFIRTQFSRVL